MQLGVFQFDCFIEVDMVEMHEGQQAGISAGALQVQSNIAALKMLVQQPRDEPASPFVEIAEHDPHPRQSGVAEDGFADQFARLALALDKRSAEMHVINVQSALFSQFDVNSQAPALFAPGHADVVVYRSEQGKSTEDEVAVH